MGFDDGHDRAAILARRQRFIAIALSSLAVACTGRTSKPQPCLSPPMPDSQGEQPPEAPQDPNPDTDATDGATEPPDITEDDASPRACLKVMPPK